MCADESPRIPGGVIVNRNEPGDLATVAVHPGTEVTRVEIGGELDISNAEQIVARLVRIGAQIAHLALSCMDRVLDVRFPDPELSTGDHRKCPLTCG